MKVSLVVLTAGKAAGQTIPVTLTQFVIGRDPQCNLRPASALISKRHCALIQKNGRVYVHDFNSTNGTFINDEQIKGEKQLQNEDTLKLGPLSFKVLIESSVAVNKPTPIPAKAGATDDDSVAAMLLSLQDDTDSTKSGVDGADEVPGGSTVMEVALPGKTELRTDEEVNKPKTDEHKKPDDKAKKPEAKKEQGNTSLAAKAILEKYTRRQRS